MLIKLPDLESPRRSDHIFDHIFVGTVIPSLMNTPDENVYAETKRPLQEE